MFYVFFVCSFVCFVLLCFISVSTRGNACHSALSYTQVILLCLFFLPGLARFLRIFGPFLVLAIIMNICGRGGDWSFSLNISEMSLQKCWSLGVYFIPDPASA